MSSEVNTAGNMRKALRLAQLFAILGFGFTPFHTIAQEISPTEPFGNRSADYPNAEAIAKDEMQVVACGTGMPTTNSVTIQDKLRRT